MIKLFEEYNQYYFDGDVDEFMSVDFFYFSEDEIEIIKGKYTDISIITNKGVDYDCIQVLESMFIFKSVDEWYWISYYDYEEEKYFYYKCDQMEGLLKCMLDNFSL